MKLEKTPVLIAGGGPVGLTLAHTLSFYGVRCLLVERNFTTTRHPKMDLTNSRSMEIYARIGVADKLRRAAIPESHEMTVLYTTSLRDTARELHRFTYPSAEQRRRIIRTVNDGTQPAQPPLRISQAVLEPTLKAALESEPRVQVRYGHELQSCEDEGDHVTATVLDHHTGATYRVEAGYVVGCDGASSSVRRSIGIALSGESGLRPSYLVHFRSTRLDVLQRGGIIWHRRSGRFGVIAQDDKETWTLQYRLEPDGSGVPSDPAELLKEMFGRDLQAEIIVANPWRANLLVADSYGRGRVYLAGDSAHQVVPSGGYGMNTGVGDAMDIGWKLAAVTHGWGGEDLLASYEAERRPVALRNLQASRRHVQTRQRIRELYAGAGDLDEDSPQGEARREVLSRQIREIGNVENESFGIEYGYCYRDSPIVCKEDGAPPEFEDVKYTPTTWPGARMPSIVLPDGSLLYERLGPWFTLVAFGAADADGFEEAARRIGMPLRVLRLQDVEAGAIYERRLVLVRPDHHVAWRGDSAPKGIEQVLATAIGRSWPELGASRPAAFSQCA